MGGLDDDGTAIGRQEAGNNNNESVKPAAEMTEFSDKAGETHSEVVSSSQGRHGPRVGGYGEKLGKSWGCGGDWQSGSG